MRIFNRINSILLFCSSLMTFSSAEAFSLQPNNVSFYAYDNIANVNGFIQIPSGGKPGTSSSQRPTFSELNLNKLTYAQFGFTSDWDLFGIYGEYQFIRPTTDSILNQTITTHSLTIPAGTRIQTDSKFDLYRLGINHKFYFMDDRLTLYPALELTGVDFSYQVKTPTQTTTRAFRRGTIRIGGGADYKVNQYLTLSANAATSIPGISGLQLQTANVDATINLFKVNQMQVALVTGLGFEHIEIKDNQELPNHARLNLSPIAHIGFKISF